MLTQATELEARSAAERVEARKREAALGEKMTDMKEQHDSARDMWREMNTTLSEQLEKAEGELVAAKLQVAELLTENEGLRKGIAPPAAACVGAFARLARRVSTRS